MTYILF
jgi:hypothetical protein